MSRFSFLADTYATERLKTLGVWAQVPDDAMEFRPEPRARTPLEHMVHQCLSEEAWMSGVLGIGIAHPALPPEETRQAFLAHYDACSAARLAGLRQQPDVWYDETIRFFDVERSRAWVMTRRIAHSAHHRGQLTAYLRLLGRSLYSTYGPTADTGGLPRHGARVIYKYGSIDDLLRGEAAGVEGPPLPGPGSAAPTERPRPDEA
ncbi:MAG: DinB family protein [Acidobacteria bacterium]|nr:DinB family protein [Acidobacteriota bacterium]